MIKGKLYIVGTPIGNLEDITYRAVNTLKNVVFILCEDTRVSKTLMKKYEIQTQLISYRDQNHDIMIVKILEKLDMGLNLALISDAGMPTISDPGFKLVKTLVSKGYIVSPIPGPDAITSSLSVSGLATDRFLFLGFLPKSDKKRADILTKYSDIDSTIIIYESPNRVESLLNCIKDILGNREVSMSNDLTKLYEKVETDKVQKLLKTSNLLKSPKGEFVVLIGKK